MLKDPQQTERDSALTVAWSRGGRLHKEIRGIKIKGYTVRTPRYRYTEWGAGKYGNELYDYQADPEEFTNLARQDDQADVVNQLSRLLKQRVRQAQ